MDEFNALPFWILSLVFDDQRIQTFVYPSAYQEGAVHLILWQTGSSGLKLIRARDRLDWSESYRNPYDSNFIVALQMLAELKSFLSN